MSTAKIIALVTYVVLGALAVTQPDSAVGIWSLRILRTRWRCWFSSRRASVPEALSRGIWETSSCSVSFT